MFSRVVRGQPYHVGPSKVGPWDKGARARAQRLVFVLRSDFTLCILISFHFCAWRESMQPRIYLCLARTLAARCGHARGCARDLQYTDEPPRLGVLD